MELTVRRKFSLGSYVEGKKFETVDFELTVVVGESELTNTLSNAFDFCEKEIDAMFKFYINHIKVGAIQ